MKSRKLNEERDEDRETKTVLKFLQAQGGEGWAEQKLCGSYAGPSGTARCEGSRQDTAYCPDKEIKLK